MNIYIKRGVQYALITLFLCSLTVSVRADQTICVLPHIIVTADKQSDRLNACSAVQHGLEFLKSIGLGVSRLLTITLSEKMPENGYDSVIGQYDVLRNEIRLLDYESVEKASNRTHPSFRVPISPAIWRSYVVHELAHAAAQQSFVKGVPVRTASEYIASAAQIATLPSAERERIIKSYPEICGFNETAEITIAYYLLDPSRFSINAYLHFSRAENGRAFVYRLLQEGLPDD